MFSIDLTLKNSPFPVSVQRKEADAANALYGEIVNAMRSGSNDLFELTCEKQPEKKAAVVISQISAVVVSQKSGAASSRATGFAAVVGGE